MRIQLQLLLEEVATFGAAAVTYSLLPVPYWTFWAAFFLPDAAMLGYMWGARLGAGAYNLAHSKTVAVVLLATGLLLPLWPLAAAGLVLLGHAAFDRAFGYGLKYSTGFADTHLGRVGKRQRPTAPVQVG